jgi:hypothetical protein
LAVTISSSCERWNRPNLAQRYRRMMPPCQFPGNGAVITATLDWTCVTATGDLSLALS